MGILTNGISCLVIGSGKFHPSGPRQGICVLRSDNEIVVLKSAESTVNSIARGRFCVNFASEPQDKACFGNSHLSLEHYPSAWKLTFDARGASCVNDGELEEGDAGVKFGYADG